MAIRKAVIPAAGFGTRLFPATLEQPKEMLPIFSKGKNGNLYVKPLLQLVFEQLFDNGVREFFFITGKAKRAIEDHFTQDRYFIKMLKGKKRSEDAEEIENFYKRLDQSTIVWINQPEPKGFGDAVYRAHPFAKDGDFLVYAGDTYIAPSKNGLHKRMLKVSSEFKAEATLLVDKVEDPRPYGVVKGELVDNGIYRVKRVVEKPATPPSNLAIVAIYLFKPSIFKALEKISTGRSGEKQLTDAIQLLINWDFAVYATKLSRGETRVDIGNPATYWDALRVSYGQCR
ncbi:MAG: sugar phosphate nucleotidyltransferase [Candidatus Bathyarchaeota archaeon]